MLVLGGYVYVFILFVSVYIDFNAIYPLLDIIWHDPPSKNSENDHVSSTSQS